MFQSNEYDQDNRQVREQDRDLNRRMAIRGAVMAAVVTGLWVAGSAPFHANWLHF